MVGERVRFLLTSLYKIANELVGNRTNEPTMQ
jgi:hypothetical protein